jgi:transcriptional regulator GlxA family with amidase domain
MARIAIVISLEDVRRLAPESGYRAKDVAKRIGLSLSQFERRFHELHGESPQRFLDVMRLEAAAAMLKATRVVKVVAIELNYTPSHLSRVFSQHFGVHPTGYIARLDRAKNKSSPSRRRSA